MQAHIHDINLNETLMVITRPKQTLRLILFISDQYTCFIGYLVQITHLFDSPTSQHTSHTPIHKLTIQTAAYNDTTQSLIRCIKYVLPALLIVLGFISLEARIKDQIRVE